MPFETQAWSHAQGGDGNRVFAIVANTGGVRATIYVDNHDEWTAGASRSYYYLGGKRVAMRDESGNPWFLLGDHLGSTSVAYRARDGQTSTQRYYAWGAVRPGPGNALPTDYTYTGQRVDERVDLLYYGARWYDASLARFAQPDSVVLEAGNPQSLNRYSYVANRPLNLTDPTGHAYDSSVGAGGAILAYPSGCPSCWTALRRSGARRQSRPICTSSPIRSISLISTPTRTHGRTRARLVPSARWRNTANWAPLARRLSPGRCSPSTAPMARKRSRTHGQDSRLPVIRRRER